MSDKDALRRHYIAARNALSPEERTRADRALSERVVSSGVFKAADCVMAYMDFGGEAATKTIIHTALSMGKKVCLPVCDSEKLTITPYEYTGCDCLRLGSYNILEPDVKTCKPIDPALIDLVLVPGVAFDMRGYRLGYGKGYYDRFLEGLKKGAVCAGMAYELQIAKGLPAQSHDKRVKLIFTDERTIEI